VDAGPGPLPNVRLTAAVDGGDVDLLVPDASVPAAAALRFETAAVLDDFRVRVLTADDRPADNRAVLTVEDGGTRVVLEPSGGWPASHGCCRLRVDGESGRLPAGASTLYLPFEAAFAVERGAAGEMHVPARRHHRHRR
jgi:hypothetical protein